MQVIESDIDYGDGVSIEREQSSTAFRPMPHIVTFDGLIARQAGFQKPDDFIKLGDIKGAFQADELTGGFDALNETTNVRPVKGEIISIVHPEFRTGLINPDSMRPVDFGSFEPRQAMLQEASANDDLTGRKGLNWSELCDVGTSLRQADELTGSFEPREVKSVEIGGLKGGQEGEELLPTDADLNDVVIGVKEKVGGTFAFETGLPVEGLHDSVHCITDGCGQNVPFGSRFPTDNFSGTSGLGGTTFMTETFEPALGMEFAGSLNPAPGLGGTAGPVCKSYLEPQLGWGEICDVGTT